MARPLRGRHTNPGLVGVVVNALQLRLAAMSCLSLLAAMPTDPSISPVFVAEGHDDIGKTSGEHDALLTLVLQVFSLCLGQFKPTSN